MWTFLLSTSSSQWYRLHSSPHPALYTFQLAVVLFLEKWWAVVTKHKGADLPNLIFADRSEPEVRFSHVDFGGFHCCYMRKFQHCNTAAGFLPAHSCNALLPSGQLFCCVRWFYPETNGKPGGSERFSWRSLRFCVSLFQLSNPRDGTLSETGFPTVLDSPGKLDVRQLCSNSCSSAGSSRSWAWAIHSRVIL